MNLGVVRLDKIMSILLTMNKHRLILLNLNYIMIDQRELLLVLWSELYEIQRNQSNLLTSKN